MHVFNYDISALDISSMVAKNKNIWSKNSKLLWRTILLANQIADFIKLKISLITPENLRATVRLTSHLHIDVNAHFSLSNGPLFDAQKCGREIWERRATRSYLSLWGKWGNWILSGYGCNRPRYNKSLRVYSRVTIKWHKIIALIVAS